VSVSVNDVVVVGSVNVDLVVAAPSLPGPGETVLGPRAERHGGGKGANAAVAAARLGAPTRLVAAVGDDAFGREALAELVAEGVDVEHVAVLADEPTGAALIVVDARGENQIAVGAGANGALAAAHVRGALARALDGAGCVLVSLEIPDAAVAAAVEAAAARGVPAVVNPAPARPAVLDLAPLHPLFTPNAGELRTLTGEADLERGAAELAARTGRAVVVTDGARGAVIVERPGAEAAQRVPAPAGVRAVDTTGAGDAFSGALATRLAAGDPLPAAVRFAVATGTCAVRREGARAGMPTADEVRALVAG
jgi:ribokinase